MLLCDEPHSNSCKGNNYSISHVKEPKDLIPKTFPLDFHVHTLSANVPALSANVSLLQLIPTYIILQPLKYLPLHLLSKFK